MTRTSTLHPRRRGGRSVRVGVGMGMAVAALLLGACASGDDGGQATTPIDTRPKSALSPAPCPIGTPTGVDCMHAEVPLSAGSPGTARLLVARVSAPGSLSWRQPLLVLPDDPAERSVTDLAAWRQVARQLGRDVVLVDRRGTGGSTPSLACPEADPTTLWVPSDQARQDYLAGLAACRQRLEAEGTDVTAFGSAAAATDLESVRVGLGVDRWHLLAGRGSLSVAAALVREVPTTVASLTVDGSHTLARGTDALTAARLVVDQVLADPALSQAWERAAALADEGQLRGRVDLGALRPGTRAATTPGQWPQLRIDGGALQTAVVAAALRGDDVGALMLDAAAGNGDRAATALASRMAVDAEDWSGGVAHTVTCAEERAETMPVGDEVVVAAWDDLFVASTDVRTCDAWSTRDLPVDTSLPGDLRVAVLLGAGGPAGLPEEALGVAAVPGPGDCAALVIAALVDDTLAPGSDPCGTGPAAAVGPGPTTTTTTSSTTTTTTTTTTLPPTTTTTLPPTTTTTRPPPTTTRPIVTTTTRPPTTTTTLPPTTTTTAPSTPPTEGPEVTAEAVTTTTTTTVAVAVPTTVPAPPSATTTVAVTLPTTTTAPTTTTTTTVSTTTSTSTTVASGSGGGRGRGGRWGWLEALLGLDGGDD